MEAFNHYKPPRASNWVGRKAGPAAGIQYWHQAVRLCNFYDPLQEYDSSEVALLGYACDEGVRRNQGRIGAQDGPLAIRSRLAKLSYHVKGRKVADYGDVHCPDQQLEASQEQLASFVYRLISNGRFPIVLGGGHDVAYGHFKGIWRAIKDAPSRKVGIINFDAHFDLRPLESTGHSGTPFYQILTEFKPAVDYVVIGIQPSANTEELFEIAKSKQVNYFNSFDCELVNVEAIINQLTPFIQKNDYLYVTIDMDGFSLAVAPGVSAPSPLGFLPNFVFKVLRYLLNTQKVIACDIAEVNPKYDLDNATANLAARLVDWIVLSR